MSDAPLRRYKITDSQIADLRVTYYTDELRYLVTSKEDACYYTHEGQLKPLTKTNTAGNSVYLLTRTNATAGVAPTLTEVQAVYSTVTSLDEGDNVNVQLSNGNVEFWDVISSTLSLRFTITPSGITAITGWAAQVNDGNSVALPDRNLEAETLQDLNANFQTLINDLRAAGYLAD